MMELLNILGIICLTVALINSEPYLIALKKLGKINESFFTCGLCTGFWIGILSGFVFEIELIWILPFAGIISIGSELLNRIIAKWNL